MWFSPDVLPLWTDVIEPATRAAGYEPLRIDSKPHNGKIDDEIMASIRASRFVVSDFTGNRGGVYYEAGFAGMRPQYAGRAAAASPATGLAKRHAAEQAALIAAALGHSSPSVEAE